jgi:hypothetical protein
MQQRGRVSANRANVIPLTSGRGRVQAPSGLTATERQLYDELVASTHATHFVASDFPLLTSYVQATLLARRYRHAKTVEQAKIFQAAVRVQGTLATRLRLTPYSRMTTRTAGRKAASYAPPSAYDTMTDDDD